ncbi:EF-hand domain-containing protein [Vibrio parahaemolyticus]|nr:EF-hand domain-containing protein [Vibrio parahaemolyticus]
MKSIKLLAITAILSLSPLANAADDSRMDFECPKDMVCKSIHKHPSDLNEMSREDMKKRMFDRIDVNGDGAITFDEFKDAKPPKGKHHKRHEANSERSSKHERADSQDKRMRPNPDKFFDMIDANGDDQVSKDEFKNFAENHKRPPRD